MERLTPEEIADLWDKVAAETMRPAFFALEEIREHGYIVIHPDDVPKREEPDAPPEFDIPEEYTEQANFWAAWWSAHGWNSCLYRIFGGGTDGP